MPIPVLCPDCSSRLNAPDAAAGKNVKCPKCGALMTIPAAEVVEAEPAPEPARPTKPTPASRKVAPVKADTTEDEDEDEDRPRKKSRNPKPKKAGAPPAVLIGAAVAGVLLLGGIAFSVYWFALRDTGGATPNTDTTDGKGSSTGQPTAVATHWKDHSFPLDGFKASFPWGDPTQRPHLSDYQHPLFTDTKQYAAERWQKEGITHAFVIVTGQFRRGKTINREEAMKVLLQRAPSSGMKPVGEPKSVTWAGRPTTETRFEADQPSADGKKRRMVVRQLATETAAYVGIIRDAGDLTPEEEARFFNSFELIPMPVSTPPKTNPTNPTAKTPSKPSPPLPPVRIQQGAVTFQGCFSVMFPARPESLPARFESGEQAVWWKDGVTGTFYEAVYHAPFRACRAGCFYYPVDATPDIRKQTLARLVGDAGREAKGYKEVSRQEVKMGGRAWQEVATKAADGPATVVVRTYEAGNLVYLLAVYQDDGTAPDEEQKKFFASFRFVK